MTSEGSLDARTGSLGKERRARLPGCPSGAIDRLQQSFVDRYVDPDGLPGQFDRHCRDSGTLRILHKDRIGFQLAQGPQKRKRIAVLDYPGDVERESLLPARQGFVQRATTRHATWKIRKGDTVRTVLLVDQGIGEPAHLKSLMPVPRAAQ